ncbi:MAG TPA: FAD-binding oxidoreductase [Mycobacteriales bacterium]
MDSDVLVLGAGIAGATAAWFLAAGGARVTVLEMEDAPGRHSTGRSAALFSEYFGSPPVRALTAASRRFLAAPPAGFADGPLLTPRGVVTVALPGQEAEFADALATARTAPGGAEEISLAEARRRVPVLRDGRYARAMHKPAAMDIDVAALHQGFLRGARVVTRARVRGLRRDGSAWTAVTTAGDHSAPVVVDAAGAWADELAGLAGAAPVGLVPHRRTACLIDPGTDAAGWPLLNDVPETFYCKPESGALLVCPSDAEPAAPGDVRARDLDVAIGIDRLEQATTLSVRAVQHAWAGLRTAAPDDVPVVGPDPAVPGFHWLAGVGGYGVQLSPAVGQLLAAAVLGTDLGRPELAAAVSPHRFAAAHS